MPNGPKKQILSAILINSQWPPGQIQVAINFGGLFIYLTLLRGASLGLNANLFILSKTQGTFFTPFGTVHGNPPYPWFCSRKAGTVQRTHGCFLRHKNLSTFKLWRHWLTLTQKRGLSTASIYLQQSGNSCFDGQKAIRWLVV